MPSNTPQRPGDGSEHGADKTFQMPLDADGYDGTAPDPQTHEGTIQEPSIGDASLNAPESTISETSSAGPPASVDATFQMPVDEDAGETSRNEKASESWHTQTAKLDADDDSRTIVSDLADVDDSSIDPATRTQHVDSASGSGMESAMRSDASQTINIESLDENERQRIESALTIGDRKSTTGSMPFQLSRGMEGEMLLQPRQIGFAQNGVGQSADYLINKVLGEGGMGTVYLAEQMSLDRLIALKVIKPLPAADRAKLQSSNRLASAEKQRRDLFLSEALVTGALDHPNIVPIHDVGRADDGAPFYSMKRVEGQSWRNVLAKNSLDENLEILLKVSDAVGFAHARGVIHRDIKPENVMLGEFGVVMLMDWGLAIVTPAFPKYGSLRQASGFGGSPAYMAPEMVGRAEDLTPSADIYLLGASLFEIITGKAPHPRPGGELTGWASVRAYLDDVVKLNVITPAEPRHQGELMDIALKAMATQPEYRYPTVQEFQRAIRGYRSHAESIALASRANLDLDKAVQSQDYADFARSQFGYEESLEMWDGNVAAQEGLKSAKRHYAEAALAKQDFDLGLSLLDAGDVQHQPLIARLKEGQAERAGRERRLKIAYRTTMALSLLLIAGGLFSLKLISDAATAREEAIAAFREKATAEKEAVAANQEKETAKREAATTVAAADARVKQAATEVASAEVRATQLEAQAVASSKKAEAAQKETMLAVVARKEAVDAATVARSDAEQAQELASKARKAADDASRLARSEEYVSQIGLARTRIEQNEFEDARRILEAIRERSPADKPMEWEWRWLWRQCHQSLGDARLSSAGADVTVQENGQAFVALDGGAAQPVNMEGSLSVDAAPLSPPAEIHGRLAVVSPDGSTIAVAGADAAIHLFDVKDNSPLGVLTGHQPGAAIRRLLFLPDGRLLSTSDDQTVRLWDTQARRELATGWHIAPVRDVAAVQTPAGLRIVTAVRDLRGGAVLVWNWTPSDGSRLQLRGEFREHAAPVTAVAVSRDGRLVASGDIKGRVLVWPADEVTRADTQDALRRAVRIMRSGEPDRARQETTRSIATELHEPRKSPGLALQSLVSTRPAHADEITRLEFNRSGDLLLSASADYTVKTWGVLDGALRGTLLGHGAGVTSAVFAQGDSKIISTGADRSVRTWDVAANDLTPEFRADSTSKLQAHFDEIWSATFDPTGKRILTAGRDHSARIIEFDAATSSFRNVGELVEESGRPAAVDPSLVEGARWVAFSMAVRSDSRRLYVADAEGFIRVWDMERAVEVASIPQTGRNFALAISPDGKRLATGSEDSAIAARLWPLNEDGAPSGEKPVDLVGPTGMLSAVAFSPNGQAVFTGTVKQTSGIGTLWDTQTGRELAVVPRLRARINAAVFSPSGDDLFIASDDSAVLQYSISRGEIMRTFPLPGYVTDLALSDDGQRLLTVSMLDAAAGARSRLTLWTIPQTGEEPQSLLLSESQFVKKNAPTADDEILSARFMPGGVTAVSVHRSHDRRVSQVRLWNLADAGKPVVERVLRIPMTIPAADLAAVVRDPKSQTDKLLSLHLDSVFQWNLRTLTHELSFRQAAAITEAAFSPDGRWIATGSRSIVLWDTVSRKSIGKVESPHEGAVATVHWDPSTPGRFASGGNDGKVRLWKMSADGAAPAALATFDAGSSVRRVRWSRDERLLAVCDDGRARVWNVAQADQAAVVFSSGESSPLLSGAFSPRGDAILAGSASGLAYVWKRDAANRDRPWAVLRGHADAVEDVGFLTNPEDPDGELRYLTASRDRSARLWSVLDVSGLSQEEPVRVREVLALRKHDLGVTAIQATPDGRTLMTASLDGRVILWPTGDDR